MFYADVGNSLMHTVPTPIYLTLAKNNIVMLGNRHNVAAINIIDQNNDIRQVDMSYN